MKEKMKKRSMIYYIYFYGNVVDEINITAQFVQVYCIINLATSLIVGNVSKLI